jgi:hypothetical protein
MGDVPGTQPSLHMPTILTVTFGQDDGRRTLAFFETPANLASHHFHFPLSYSATIQQ